MTDDRPGLLSATGFQVASDRKKTSGLKIVSHSSPDICLNASNCIYIHI